MIYTALKHDADIATEIRVAGESQLDLLLLTHQIGKWNCFDE